MAVKVHTTWLQIVVLCTWIACNQTVFCAANNKNFVFKKNPKFEANFRKFLSFFAGVDYLS